MGGFDSSYSSLLNETRTFFFFDKPLKNFRLIVAANHYSNHRSKLQAGPSRLLGSFHVLFNNLTNCFYFPQIIKTAKGRAFLLHSSQPDTEINKPKIKTLFRCFHRDNLKRGVQYLTRRDE